MFVHFSFHLCVHEQAGANTGAIPKRRTAKRKMLSNAFSKAVIPNPILLKIPNDNCNWHDKFMASKNKQRLEPGESDNDLLNYQVDSTEINGLKEPEPTENSDNPVRKSKRLPNATRVVKWGTVMYT